MMTLNFLYVIGLTVSLPSQAFFYAPTNQPMKATHLGFVSKGMKKKWGLDVTGTSCERIVERKEGPYPYANANPYYNCSISTAQGVQCQSRSDAQVVSSSAYARTVNVILSVSCSNGHSGAFRNRVHVQDYGIYTSRAPDLQCGGRGCSPWP